MIKLTPSSISVMVDTLRFSGRDRYIIFRMKTRDQKAVYMRYPQHFENIANQENMIVIVEAQKFLPLWQRSPYAVDQNACAGDESKWRKDYKFHLAENGFAKSMDSPIPLADVNVHIKDGEISCSLNDGMTRTLWLLANGVEEFPILVRNHKEKAKLLSRYISPLSSLNFEPLNLYFAITGEKHPL